ncbi:alpha/beta fold hydrolase [Antarctobacter sp.]|uniref:alpha/beta fold hydrolase n=1 Tax=Antarctobacter sp. TaxID=1872577 RepID=UPI003A9468A5
MDQSAQRKTYVLVHGAYHGGWCWATVAEGLRALGHRVFTPTLTGLGERAHLLRFHPCLNTWIEDVAQVMRFEDLSEVILVGHSFSGSIVSALADRMPERLRRLVYLDAMLLQSGQSPKDISAPGVIEAYEERARANDGIAVPPNPPAHYGVTDPDMAVWFATKLTPHPVRTYLDALHLDHPLGNGVPATYIACSAPFFATTRKSRAVARAMAGWTYLEIATAHNAMTLAPDLLTKVLDRIETAMSEPSTEDAAVGD